MLYVQGATYALPFTSGLCGCVDARPVLKAPLLCKDVCPGNIGQFCGNKFSYIVIDTGLGK